MVGMGHCGSTRVKFTEQTHIEIELCKRALAERWSIQ